jgi:hypothetical protein
MQFYEGAEGAVISRSVLLCAAAACAGFVILRAGYWLTAYDLTTVALMIAAGLAAAFILAFVGIRQRGPIVRRSALELVLLGCALLAAEVAITSITPGAWTRLPFAAEILSRQQKAHRLGKPFDIRTVSEVVQELRAQGVDALPRISRKWVSSPRARTELPSGFLPLSHASNATIVECNENGEYLIFRSDEFGFNNPSRLVASKQVDVAVVGESFALGYCLPAEESFVGRIRAIHPRTANFALAGTIPLMQLASLREYVEPLRPSLVLWTVNPTEVHPQEESRDPILLQYLNPSFSQNLMARQSEVDSVIRRLVPPMTAETDEQLRAELQRARAWPYSRALFIPQIRERLGPSVGAGRWFGESAHPAQFENVLKVAHAAVRQWHGKLLVVLLPTYGENVARQIAQSTTHTQLTKLLTGLGIEVIDGVALFEQQPDVAGLFNLRMNAHPNRQGHALLADRVLAAMKELPQTVTQIQE